MSAPAPSMYSPAAKEIAHFSAGFICRIGMPWAGSGNVPADVELAGAALLALSR